MVKRPKRPTDPFKLAVQIGREATGQKRIEDALAGGEPIQSANGKNGHTNGQAKNPAAVALGRLGGLKGGKARAAKLGAEERSRIAREAALRRWKQKP